MTVVIDTNVLLPLFSPRSPTPEIVDALTDGSLKWAISQSIYSEYREVVASLSGEMRWRQIERVIHLLGLRHQSILWVEPKFQFRVISVDPDDNKFCDCAITANADYVLTEDGHFAPLRTAGYRPQPISPIEFAERYLRNG